MKIIQTTLRSLDGNNRMMTTWLENTDKLQEGAVISLKDHEPDIKWRVELIYKGQEKDAHSFDWHRKWDNNI